MSYETESDEILRVHDLAREAQPETPAQTCTCGHQRKQHCNGECMVDGCACGHFASTETPDSLRALADDITSRSTGLLTDALEAAELRARAAEMEREHCAHSPSGRHCGQLGVSTICKYCEEDMPQAQTAGKPMSVSEAASFIAEATEVLAETGLTPRKFADKLRKAESQLADALAALRQLYQWSVAEGPEWGRDDNADDARRNARALLAKGGRNG